MIGLSQDQPLGATPIPPATDKPDEPSFPPMQNGDKPPKPEEEEIKEKLADLDIKAPKPPAETPPPNASGKPKKTKVVMAVLALLFMVASIPAAVYLVKQRQEIRKEAACEVYHPVGDESCEEGVLVNNTTDKIPTNPQVWCGQDGQCPYTQKNDSDCCAGTDDLCACSEQDLDGDGDGDGDGGGENCEGQSCVEEREKNTGTSADNTYIFYCQELSCTCDQNVYALRCDNNNKIDVEQTGGKVENLCDYKKYITYQGQEVPCECFAWQVDWMDSGGNLLGWRMGDETTPLEQCLTTECTGNCNSIKVYDEAWDLITDYNTIIVGQSVYFAVQGDVTDCASGWTEGRFDINGAGWTVTTDQNASGEFYVSHTIISAGTHTVKAMIHCPELGWK